MEINSFIQKKVVKDLPLSGMVVTDMNMEGELVLSCVDESFVGGKKECLLQITGERITRTDTYYDLEGNLVSSDVQKYITDADLSSELTNYWKISKDTKDPTKVISQEMDYLVMRDWASEGRGHNIKRFMYVKQGDWYCDPSRNSFDGGPDVTVEAQEGTSTGTMSVGPLS